MKRLLEIAGLVTLTLTAMLLGWVIAGALLFGVFWAIIALIVYVTGNENNFLLMWLAIFTIPVVAFLPGCLIGGRIMFLFAKKHSRGFPISTPATPNPAQPTSIATAHHTSPPKTPPASPPETPPSENATHPA